MCRRTLCCYNKRRSYEYLNALFTVDILCLLLELEFEPILLWSSASRWSSFVADSSRNDVHNLMMRSINMSRLL